MKEAKRFVFSFHVLVADSEFKKRFCVHAEARILVEHSAVSHGRRLVLGALQVEIPDLHHVVGELRAKLLENDLAFSCFGVVGIAATQDLQVLQGFSCRCLIPVNRTDLFVVTECRAQHRVWNLRVLRVEVAKIPVVGEGFVIASICVVGVRDLELGFGFIFAVGVVVDDGLESFDGLVVIDPVVEPEDPCSFELTEALLVELFGGRDVLEEHGVLGTAQRQAEAQQESQGQTPGPDRAGSRFFVGVHHV